MVIEMVLLVLIALAVFAYVLSPIVFPRHETAVVDDPLHTGAEDEDPEPAADKQPAHERS